MRLVSLLLLLGLATSASAQDSDGDGVPNALELSGFRFDLTSGEAVGCTPGTDAPCYVTDPLAWSSDGDPYSDFQEASGVNMDASVEAPYNSPLVAAYPVIEVALDSYTFTSNATITDAQGAALTSGTSFSRDVSETVGASATVGGEYNAITGPTVSGEATASYSRTEAYGTEVTSGAEINWETATSTELNNAGTLSLSLFARNSGGATALNVRPTFNVYIGSELVETVLPDVPLSLSLAPGGSSATVVPIVDGNALGIQLTFDQLLALERGGAVSIEVVDILADIQRWRPGDSNWTCGSGETCTWTSFQNQIEPRTLRLLVDFGYSGDPDAVIPAQFRGNPFDYRIYTGSPSTSPNLTLRDVLGLAGFSVTGNGNAAAIEGRSYLDSWILFEQPPASGVRPVQDAWQDAGRPQSMLDVVMPRQATLGLTSPDPQNPGAAIRALGVTSDFLNIRAVVVARGGVPVTRAVASVVQNGVTRTVDLQPVFGRAYWSTEGSSLPDIPIGMETSYVEFTDLAGDVRRSRLPLTIQQAASCADVPETDLRPAPGAGGQAILFPTGSLDGPVEAYCVPNSDVTRYWVPQRIAPAGRMTSSVRLDDGTAVAAGRGGIYRSETQGRSWVQVSTPDSDAFGVTYSPDTQTLMALSDSSDPDGYVRSTDGGRTWTRFNTDRQMVRLTHGGGRVWYATDWVFTAGQTVDRVLKSDDDGESFTPVSRPATSELVRDIAFRDADTGLVLVRGDGTAGSGGIWRTDDGGASWTQVLRSHGDNYLTYAGESTWYVVGGADALPERVLRSTDDGLNWTILPLSLPNDAITRAPTFLTSQIGYIPVSRTGLLMTRDGGDTWALEPIADEWVLDTVLPFDENRAVALGGYLSASEFVGVSLLTTSGGTGTVVVSNEPTEPGRTAARLVLDPAAPNPFRQRTVLTYRLDAPGDVLLTVHDLLGREVARLADGAAAAGEHTEAFDASGLAAGVYLVRLRVGSMAETRSITVVR